MAPETYIQHAIAILLLPLLGFVTLIFFGKRLPRGGDWLGMSFLFIALIMSLIVAFHKLTDGSGPIVWNFPWV
ncbi:MAG TPA: hypothetical protein VKS81_02920, partial [Bacteroidota bacterium]|nr:hypothetical protein [Bacteroidota bacterium]